MIIRGVRGKGISKGMSKNHSNKKGEGQIYVLIRLLLQ